MCHNCLLCLVSEQYLFRSTVVLLYNMDKIYFTRKRYLYFLLSCFSKSQRKVLRYWIYHCHIYHHELQRHIRSNNFRSRDNIVLLHYSYHTLGYIPDHIWTAHILLENHNCIRLKAVVKRLCCFVNIRMTNGEIGLDQVYVMRVVLTLCTLNNRRSENWFLTLFICK